MYILFQEYEGLTTKIHELQLREEKLQEILITEDALPPFSPSPPESTPLQWGDWEPFTLTPNSSTGNLQLNATSAGVKLAQQQTQGSPLLGSKSMRNVVKVRLPNDQKTAVSSNTLTFFLSFSVAFPVI